MKQFFTLFTVIFLLGMSHYSFAQPCTPNTSFTQAGIYPDTMPEGTVGQAYSENITFVLPTDTSGFDFTNFEIISISLPVGLNWVCNNASNGCNYNPQTNVYGCVNVSGTPLLAGDYNVTVSVMATLQVVGNVPTTFDVFMRINPAESVTTNDGFSMSGFSGCSPVTVEFTNNNPGLLAYSWDFGNGNTSTSENPAPQIYNIPGDYIVNYQAWDNLTTVHVYTLTNVTITSMDNYGGGFPSFENADAYYKIFENGVLFAQSSIIADTDPTVSWTTSNILDPTKTYTIEIWESDAGEIGFGADDYMGIHTMNINGCNGCSAGTSTINYTISHQVINPTPLVTSVDTIHVYGFPGVPNIYFDSINQTLHTDSISNDIQWYLEGSPIGGATSSSLVIETSGNYSLIAVNAGGCVSFSDSLYAIVCPDMAAPVITQPNQTELQVANPNGYAVQWYLNGNVLPNGVSETQYMPQGGIYSVVLTNLEGCKYTSADFVSNLGVLTLDNKPFSIYPNPSTGIVYIKALNEGNFDVTVRDMAGRIVKVGSAEVLNQGIDLSENGKGIYFLEINTVGSQYVEKVIIK